MITALVALFVFARPGVSTEELLSSRSVRKADGVAASRQSPPLLLIFAAAFLLLIVANVRYLFAPPYWDAIVGSFTEAIWLKHHHFDYFALWTEQLPYLQGGPAVYLYSIMPTVYAVALSLFSPEIAFLLLHLLTLACAALVFAVSVRLLSELRSPIIAFALCIAALINPIFSGQTAAINMEMPLAAATLLSVYALYRQRYLATMLWACGAFLIKESALILALALTVFTVVQLIMKRTRFQDITLPLSGKNIAMLFGPTAFAVLVKLAFSVAYPYTFEGASLADRIDKFIYRASFLFPDVALLLPIIAVFVIIAIVTRRKQTPSGEFRKRFAVGLLLAIFVAGFWLGFVMYRNALPRYIVFVLFPMVILTGLVVPWRNITVLIASALLLWGTANQTGAFLPAPSFAVSRSGEILERSREYLLDQKADMQLCRELEQHYADRIIAAKYPFLHMLTWPELGYVKKPLPHVAAVTLVPNFLPVKPYDPATMNKHRPIFIFAPNQFEFTTQPILIPPQEKTVIFQDDIMTPPITAWSW